MSNALTTLAGNLATKFSLTADTNLIDTLKATAFKGQVSEAQMTALLIVAQQHGLNPWTKEIYAFPDKNNGIVPVVGVDGWSRIINEHPMFDGMDFQMDDDSCTCRMFRKDRSHPISITEYASECRRSTGPWISHPKRMLRHKAMVQCARMAFGYAGIYDQDEAEHLVEVELNPIPPKQPGKKANPWADSGETPVTYDFAPATPEPAVIEFTGLSEDQQIDITAAAREAGMTVEQICTAGKVANLKDIPADKFDKLLKWVKASKKPETVDA